MRIIAASVISALAFTVYPAAQPATHVVSLPDLLSIRQVTPPRLSPDARWIVYAVRGWENGTGKDSERKDARSHVWRVSADGAAPARQLTFSDRGESAPDWSPDGTIISFLSARQADGAPAPVAGTDPQVQIWLMRADGGEAWPLTDSKESITTYAWSPDSSTIAFVARDPLPKAIDEKHKRRDDAAVFEGDFRLSHLWVVDAKAAPAAERGARARELTHDPHLTVQGAPTWSADSRRIAFAAQPTTMIRDTRSDIFIVSASGGAAEKITTNPGPDADPVWSPDGTTIAYSAAPNDAPPLADGTQPTYVGNDHLMLYDVGRRIVKDAASRDFDLSPGSLSWSPDSKSLLFSSGVKTARDLFAYDVKRGAYARLTHGRITAVGSMVHDRVALVMESSSEPPEIYVAPLKPASVSDLDAKKLTDTNPHARAFALGASEVVSWKSDGLTIEGVLLEPVHYEAGKRYPLLVVAHGGPSGAFLDNYRVGYGDGSQNWAGEGWAVLYPNPRGSTNYGEQFERANLKDWGGGDYRDIMSGVDAMIARGIADPDRLAFQGWSYGGYLTCWVVSQTTRFKAAMQGAGLTDLASMYGTNDIPNVMIPYFGGVPSKDTLPFYAQRSGITYVDRVTTPLLILHGGSDQRVPIGQPMEFFRALKDRGKTVELAFYPREGHGFSEYYHQLDRLERQHDWIARYTLGAGARKTTEP
ncbi:MAG TPA: S9 family peptidase [Vicinamibacterales bacterium]|nr:S9 family peptidase [Vicinamibacterales bacterium]